MDTELNKLNKRLNEIDQNLESVLELLRPPDLSIESLNEKYNYDYVAVAKAAREIAKRKEKGKR